jgi:ribosome maturation factor RimP
MDVRRRAGAATPGASLVSAEIRAKSSQSFLSMYAEAPNHEVTLEDFEVSAFERLKGARQR